MKDGAVRPNVRRKTKGGWKSGKPRPGAPDHVKMHDAVVLVDEPFDLGSGVTAMAPGQSGVAGHDINCRCNMLTLMMTDAQFFKVTGRHFPGAQPEQEIITKSRDYAVDSKMLESREFADKIASLDDSEEERREFLKAAKEMLHHCSGQNGEDLYLYSRETKRWYKSIAGKTANTPEYNKEVLDILRSSSRGEMVAFHNHPSGMLPSVSDLNAALYNRYSFGCTLGHNGTIYRYIAPAVPIDEYAFSARVDKFKESGYDESAAQLETLRYFASLYDFRFGRSNCMPKRNMERRWREDDNVNPAVVKWMSETTPAERDAYLEKVEREVREARAKLGR